MRRRWLAVLASVYWKPVYKHIRMRWRKQVDESRDLTQEFLMSALERRVFESYDPARGRLRAFLRTCLDRFVADRNKADRRLKREGGGMVVRLDVEQAEEELARATSRAESAEDCFDREWARSILSIAIDELRRECEARGKRTHFRVFERYVLEGEGGDRPSYADIARELDIKVTDVTNYLSFTRRELRRLALEKLRDLTASEEELESEARALLGA